MAAIPIAHFSAEDGFRADVASMYNKCNGDVVKMLEKIGEALNDTGRNDVKIHADPSGSIVSLTQSTQFAMHNNRHAAFLANLEEATKQVRGELQRHKTRLEKEIPTGPFKTDEEFRREVYRQMILSPTTHRPQSSSHGEPFVPASARSRSSCHCGARNDGRVKPSGPRTFPLTDKDRSYKALPTSQYNGNYTLQRYGGCFPKHAHYGHYRRYGQKGCGAATAEYHNYPGGENPDTAHLFQ